MAQNSHKIKTIILAVAIFLLLLPSPPAKAAPDMGMPSMGQPQRRQRGSRRTRNTERKTPQQKREELIAAANNAQTEISEKYALIIDAVNTGQQLEKPFLIETKKTVLKNRRYLAVFEDQQKCDYHALAAWSYHFGNKQKKATDNAESAQQAVPDNHNAIATRLTLGVLYEDYEAVIASLTQTEKAPEPEPKKRPKQIQKPQQTSPGMGMPGMMPGMGMPGMSQQGYTQQRKSSKRADGQLDIDPNLIRIDLLAKPFDPNTESLNNTDPELEPNSISCLLLWKLDDIDLDTYAIIAEPNEPNEPNEPDAPTDDIKQTPAISAQSPQEDELPPGTAGMFAKAKKKRTRPQQQPSPGMMNPQMGMPQQGPGMMMMPGMMPGMTPQMPGQTPQSQDPAETGPQYTLSTRIHPEIIDYGKMALRLGGNENLKFAMVNINDSADIETVANYLKYNPFPLPLLTITDSNSLDSTFIENTDSPTLLIIAPDKMVKYAGTISGFLPQATIESLLARPELFAEPAKLTIAELPPEPAVPAEQTITPPVQSEQPQPNEPAEPAVKKPTPPDEDYFDPHAEKLIENARAFIKISNVMVQGRSYKKPVDLCRQIIKNYPDTKYEDQARILMRSVPKRYRKRYNMTDEELGI